MGEKKKYYGGVRFFRGAIPLLIECHCILYAVFVSFWCLYQRLYYVFDLLSLSICYSFN